MSNLFVSLVVARLQLADRYPGDERDRQDTANSNRQISCQHGVGRGFSCGGVCCCERIRRMLRRMSFFDHGLEITRRRRNRRDESCWSRLIRRRAPRGRVARSWRGRNRRGVSIIRRDRITGLRITGLRITLARIIRWRIGRGTIGRLSWIAAGRWVAVRLRIDGGRRQGGHGRGCWRRHAGRRVHGKRAAHGCVGRRGGGIGTGAARSGSLETSRFT